MESPLRPGETVLASQDAGWVNRDGVVSRGELVVTPLRVFFLPRGWRHKPEWFPEFNLPWDQLDTTEFYPVGRASHIFVRSRPGDPLPRDDWNREFPVPEPRPGTWRFWAKNMHMARFAVLGLKGAGFAETERHVWSPDQARHAR
jgi:hypothetical protein